MATIKVTSVSRAGIFWSFGFVIPEAIQAVFFGSLLQRMDSFVIAGSVFTITTIGAAALLVMCNPAQLFVAMRHPKYILLANVTNALAWTLYLLSVQLIEPVIAYTIFSGFIPLTTLAFAFVSGCKLKGIGIRPVLIGNLLIGAALIWLAVITLGGWSGFTRGSLAVSLTGISIAAISGAMLAAMLIVCSRLHEVGLGPIGQMGTRFLLHIVLCIVGFAVGLDHKGSVPLLETVFIVVIALPLMTFPMLSIQKAITYATPMTIGMVSALGPFFVFFFQLVDSRVVYAPATLIGLFIFFLGAAVAVWAQTTQKEKLQFSDRPHHSNGPKS